MNTDTRHEPGMLGMATAENSRQPDYGRAWGPWKEWNGHGIPSDAVHQDFELFVQVHRRSPNSDHWLVDEAHHINWSHDGSINDVLAYRVEAI